MENEIMVYEAAGDIQINRSPDVVLAEATEAAKALGTVLAGKKKKVIMNNEQYLEFEDWQTVGRFYGVTAKVKETAFITYGNAQGFEAKAVAIRADGMEISAAEAMCLNDEEKWRARPKYKYLYILKDGSKSEEDPPKDQIVWVDNPGKPGSRMPKKERILTGEESVPLFQLRSMAQTRACAKALRNVLAWVVVLAGYRPTPAEELDGMTHVEDNGKTDKQPIQQPKEKTEESKVEKPDEAASVISEAQRKRLYAIYKKAEKTDEQVKAHLKTKYGIEHSKDIPKSVYEDICAWAETGVVEAETPPEESFQIDCPKLKLKIGKIACEKCATAEDCEPYQMFLDLQR